MDRLGYRWKVKDLPTKYANLAKDKSEIRHVYETDKASVVHCTLAPKATSVATRNLEIEEIWYFIGGQGQIWLKEEDEIEGTEKDVGPSTCVLIPAGVHFQFRSTTYEPLTFLCITMPRWPGQHASMEVEAHWKPS
jgi:mannose-6-phosphate isomerase-like protein (cupin superfamily)